MLAVLGFKGLWFRVQGPGRGQGDDGSPHKQGKARVGQGSL